MPNAASYTVPDNPADLEAAALDLIERLPADILHTGAFTEVLQDYCSVPHADGAFAGLEWADARQIAAAVAGGVVNETGIRKRQGGDRRARGSARQRAGTRPAMDDHRPIHLGGWCVSQLLGVIHRHHPHCG